MHTVAIGDWAAFFTAQLGAAATLGGLIFVGLSLNLEKILSFPALPNRALFALGILAVQPTGVAGAQLNRAPRAAL